MDRGLCLALLTFFLLSCGATAAPTASSTPAGVPPPTDAASPPTPTGIPATAASSSAASFPDASAYHWAPVVSGLDHPVDIQFSNDGSGRMFIIEQVGRIRMVKNNQLVAAPFLDITDRVGSNGSERGLLGLAFHPDYTNNGFFYVNYTDLIGNTVIARFHASD